MRGSGAVRETAGEGQRKSQVLDPSESMRSHSSPPAPAHSTVSWPFLRTFFLSRLRVLDRNDNPVLRHAGRLTSPARFTWMVLGALLLVAVGTGLLQQYWMQYGVYEDRP